MTDHDALKALVAGMSNYLQISGYGAQAECFRLLACCLTTDEHTTVPNTIRGWFHGSRPVPRYLGTYFRVVLVQLSELNKEL